MYRFDEMLPDPALKEIVECYWTLEVLQDHERTVVPDAAIDLVLFWRGRELESAHVFGTMTRPRVVRLTKGQLVSGIRFRPGMFSATLPTFVPELTDRVVSLGSLASPSAGSLAHALHRVRSFEDGFTRLERVLKVQTAIRPVQRTIHEMCLDREVPDLSEWAAKAFLSDRQFRRLCIQETGLSPKHLQRLARFHSVWLAIRDGSPSSLGELALDHGFSDQAHLIHEFRGFTGTTPGAYVKTLR